MCSSAHGQTCSDRNPTRSFDEHFSEWKISGQFRDSSSSNTRNDLWEAIPVPPFWSFKKKPSWLKPPNVPCSKFCGSAVSTAYTRSRWSISKVRDRLNEASINDLTAEEVNCETLLAWWLSSIQLEFEASKCREERSKVVISKLTASHKIWGLGFLNWHSLHVCWTKTFKKIRWF